MKVMSESIQRVAGASMRRVVNTITRSRIRGIFTGWFTTSLLQSSSATTVMTVSLVNAGVLRLREAVGVILGANIGTTITAWVIAFAVGRVDIRELALPMIALALPFLFLKRAQLRYTAETFIGFALMFIGLQLLQGYIPNLRGTPELFEFFSSAVQGRFASPLLFVILGTLVAMLVQSSTAAIALTVALMTNGIITVETAAAMVLGENMGTTITANIAAVVANTEARRAARIHTLFNVLGVVWMILLVRPVIGFIDAQLTLRYSGADEAHNAIVIAIFHTGFNVANVLLLVGFSEHLVNLSARLVRNTGKEDQGKGIEYIGNPIMATPELAVLEVQKEMRRFARTVIGMNRTLRALLEAKEEDERVLLQEDLKRAEEVTDQFKRTIARYVTELSRREISDETSQRLTGLMGAANNLERIGDLYYQVAKNLENKSQQKVYFIPRQRQSLKEMSSLIDEAFAVMLDNLRFDQESVDAGLARLKENEINALRDDLRIRHLKDVTKDRYSHSSGVFYSDTFVALEEIADNIFGVSEGLSF